MRLRIIGLSGTDEGRSNRPTFSARWNGVRSDFDGKASLKCGGVVRPHIAPALPASVPQLPWTAEQTSLQSIVEGS